MATFSGSTLGSTVPAVPGCAEVVGDWVVVVSARNTSPDVLGSGTYTIRHLPTNTVRAFDGFNNYHRNPHSSTVLDGIMWVVSSDSGLVGTPAITGINPVDGSLTTGPNNGSGFGVAAGGRIWYGTSTLTGWSPSTNTTVTTPSGVHSFNTATAFGSDRLYTYRSSNQSIHEIDTDTGDVVAIYPSPAVCANRGVVIGDHIWWCNGVGGSTLVRFHVPTGDAVALPVTPAGLTIPNSRPRLGADGTIWWIDRIFTDRAQITVVNTSTMQWAQGDSPLAYEGPFAWAMHDGTPIIAYGEPTS